MPERITFLFIFLLLTGCAGHDFQQADARLGGASSNTLPSANKGQVLVRANPNYQRNKLHQLLWGKHYRQVWAAAVPVPVLDLNQFPHDLRPKKLGGGLQTTSLSLTDTLGRTFTLRTLDKDPTKSLSPRLKKSLVNRIMRDQTSAVNPYGSFTVPPLAQAAGVFHTNPKLFYVPANGAGLAEYSSNFTGQLAMLEEKYENVADLSPAFGQVTEVIDTEKLFERLEKSHDHRIDQPAMARARLLDVILGDWDRHEGQWTWAKYNIKNSWHLYKPLPKDRDYVYYRYDDGLIPWLLSRRILAGKIKSFIHNIPDLGGLIYKGRDLDQRMLNKLTAEEWTAIARDMQAALTNEVLQQALRQFPDSVYQLEGERIYRYLQKRVDRLPVTAKKYYRLLAREVTISGSDQKEKFIITGLPDRTTRVQVFTIPKNNQESPLLLYQRVFRPEETKEITLNALGGSDEYVIESISRKGPTIFINRQKNKDLLTGELNARYIKILETKKTKAKEKPKT